MDIKNLPVFELIVDEIGGGITANAFVYSPANEVQFIAFSKEEERELLFKNEAERMVTGALIIPDKKIYRSGDGGIGPHYVVFTKEAIKDMVKKFAKNDKFNSTNTEHKFFVDGAYMIESWIVGENDKSRDFGFDIPEGAWMATFYVENEELWSDIQSGKYRGFSIEGSFKYQPVVKMEEEKIEETVEQKEEIQEEIKESIKEVIEEREENIFLSILNDEKLTDQEKEEKIISWLGEKK